MSTVVEKVVEKEAADRGSYLLILRLPRPCKIRVGELGRVSFRSGYYVYVGSAMKNLASRIERHKRERKTLFWHIDYLRSVSDFHGALAVRSSSRLECDIARSLKNLTDGEVPRFGSSDCPCPSHLFFMASDPLHSPAFHRMLRYFRMERLVHAG